MINKRLIPSDSFLGDIKYIFTDSEKMLNNDGRNDHLTQAINFRGHFL